MATAKNRISGPKGNRPTARAFHFHASRPVIPEPLLRIRASRTASSATDGVHSEHEAGVIHRDLKPANVRITPTGKVKVLDFALAKPSGPEASKDSTADSVLSTEPGRLLGTPTYMASEQARGRSIDRRVDVWALGCALYECLRARRAFTVETDLPPIPLLDRLRRPEAPEIVLDEKPRSERPSIELPSKAGLALAHIPKVE